MKASEVAAAKAAAEELANLRSKVGALQHEVIGLQREAKAALSQAEIEKSRAASFEQALAQRTKERDALAWYLCENYLLPKR